MTPYPLDPTSKQTSGMEQRDASGMKKPRIVISGMSGMFPKSHNVKDLSEILYNKVNPVTSENLRWNYKHPETTNYIGMTPDLEYFDAQFFTVYHRLGNYMDPMSRKILEHSYQALYDAGVSPLSLSGKKVAVIVGSSLANTEHRGVVDFISKTGLGIIGCSKTMFANRVSYWLNVKGPSVSIDEADCSSIAALEQAYHAIARGDCEAAIVAGASLNLLPEPSVYHRRLACVAGDGKTKSFDKNSDGYALSDTIGVLFLQNAEQALRVYAEVKYVKTEYISLIRHVTGPQYGYCRNPETAANFIKEFYKEAQVAPQAVGYVEAYGTGVPEADKSELESIAKAYCEDRNDPLLVGSVTSNIGLTEAASGMAALTKVLLGYYTGELAANLHCSEPRQDIAALRDGRMRIVTEHQRLHNPYIALNGMSHSGANSHVLLQGHYKPKDLSRYKSAFPRLVTISGRQESAVEKIFSILKSKPIDAEELALLHNIHSTNISGHLGRGYIILDTNENQKTVSLGEKVEYFNNASRPLWFVYSGMGSQWATMGAQLMRIPIFGAAIERCHQVLKPRGLNLVDIITSPDKTIFNNILHSFVGIAAIQIGLTDILFELGLKPDGIIGHSVGELGCAYADGCLTAEEMILAAYSRGRVSLETPLIRGSMAAVGLGYDKISKMCPPEIDVACHNGPDSSTISGPADVMREFVAHLTAKGIFAKEVPCSNIAYHSRYIADAGPNLLKYLKEVIKNPKPRSERWLSSSVPQDKWDNSLAKYCSAEYQTNNLLSPVLFDETSKLIPNNAVLIEIAPHGLLQAILKRSMSADCQHVPLTKRGHPDNTIYLLQAIGNLYMEGYKPNIQNLYPKIEFPVSTATPMLSHLPEWVHTELWMVINCFEEEKISAAACKFIISVHDEEHCYLKGNMVGGKMCYPFSAALVAVWDALAMSLGKLKKSISVQFSDIHLYAQPELFDQRLLRFDVELHRGTGKFEVRSNKSRVAAGYITRSTDMAKELSQTYDHTEDMVLTSQDLYQLLRDKKFSYEGEFRSIECANESLTEAALIWRDNWVTLIDGMLQLNVLQQAQDSVILPKRIRRLCIDTKRHDIHKYVLNNKDVMPVLINNLFDYTRCGGILLQNVLFRNTTSTTEKTIELLTPQLVENTNPNLAMKTAVTLQNSQIGRLDSLHWTNAPLIKSSNIIVTVHYAGLNMLDVKKATGITPCDVNSYGMDFSGLTDSGERVMGIVRSGAASTQVCAQPNLLWPVPAHWTLQDAATVPLAYLQAFYCLKIMGQMLNGMSVLVHGGAGGLGQALIAVALGHDCQVFTTVGDIRKKRFLQKMFPQLKDYQISNSRDGSFVDNVMLATHGKGCDIVINCIKGNHKNGSLKCIRWTGALIDTVQIESQEEFAFGMHYLTAERAYKTVDLSNIFTDKKFKNILHGMLSEGIACGFVRPLSQVTYEPDDVARGFRLLAASQHRGRVLLRVKDSITDTQQRLIISPHHCHLLFWDDDVLGVLLVDRLINRGAKRIYIHCPNPTEYHDLKIKFWQNRGIEVALSRDDVTEAKDLMNVMNNAINLGPIEGIYVVNTMSVVNKFDKDFSTSLKDVDFASRILCQNLRYFLVATTNSSAAQNVCLSRVKSGFAATLLDLSSLSEGTEFDRRVAIEAMEQAVCSGHVVLAATNKQGQSLSLLEQIAALTDIQIPENASPGDNLLKFGIPEEKSSLISTYLNVTYNIYFNEEDVLLLTVKEIKELEESTRDIVMPNNGGLETFFSSVCYDELEAAADVIVIPTRYKDITLTRTEFDVNQKYLCIVPGIEGHNERFRVISERLKLPAFVLQPGLDHPHETVQETAQRLANILMKKRLAQNNFYLLGNESGVMVALELAAILEDKGLTGTVFCVGFAPDELQAEVEEQLRGLESEERLQDAVVHHMISLMAGKDIEGLGEVLRHATTWLEKVEACVNYLKAHTTHSLQYVRALLLSALARINQVRRYSGAISPLRSQLVLLRATATQTSPELDNLQKYSQHPITKYQISSSLSNITNDSECAAIINKHLDAEVHDKFEKQNQCETYVHRIHNN